jgi:hypothetical protein
VPCAAVVLIITLILIYGKYLNLTNPSHALRNLCISHQAAATLACCDAFTHAYLIMGTVCLDWE